jgi:hypothetical protein
MKMGLLMSGNGVWVQVEILPIGLRVLLPMKDGLKAAADGTWILPIKRKSMRIPS